MNASGNRDASLPPTRRDRLLKELVHDPYMATRKLPEPTVCPSCEAVFHEGRWMWGERPTKTAEVLCPACRRAHDKEPAGLLTISGEFWRAHEDEIKNLARNVESREKAEHPMKRIMDMDTRDDRLAISFTEPHLARAVGEAIEHAYNGELDFRYNQGEYYLRVTWRR